MRKHPTPQVFYDPKGRRWRRFLGTVLLAGVALVIVFGALIAGVTSDPMLPPSSQLFLTTPVRFRPANPLQSLWGTANPGRTPWRHTRPAPPVRIPRMAQATSSERIGFYANWDFAGETSLKANLAHLTKLVPVWLHALDATGAIAVDDPGRQAEVLAYIRKHRPSLPIVPLVNNFNDRADAWDTVAISRMLATPGARTRAVQNLLRFVEGIQGAGICIDFEDIPTSTPDRRAFMRALYARFHPLGLEVAQVLPLDDPDTDYRALAGLSDYLILRAYDEHGGYAGPVASQGWYATGLRHRFAELAPARFVIAIGTYGYDWAANAATGRAVSYQEVMNAARESRGGIVFDPSALNPRLAYNDNHNTLHRIWFLDAVTAFNELAEGERYRPRGFALWRLGPEDPSIWRLFDRRSQFDRAAAQRLRALPPGYDLDNDGSGEIAKVTGLPRTGARMISFEPVSGYVTQERVSTYPSGYVVTRWGGGDPKKIALTFDDGPDPRYTPAVLDVLRRYHVPATFFVIGSRAIAGAGLIGRMVQEGHEVGNHTFTHPNIAAISPAQLGVEINATERLLEAVLGRRTILFRAPYDVDSMPATPDQVRSLAFTSRLGYYVVDMNVDPEDWKTPGIDQIVQSTLAQATHHAGNIVLLHDGGGDRSQTVAALPRIIAGLRSRGFQLVTVSGLLGVTRDAVMPPIPESSVTVAHINGLGFTLMDWTSRTLRGLFMICVTLGILRPLGVATLAIIRGARGRSATDAPGYVPFVSVVVPAYNEEKVILQTVHTLLCSTYPNFDVIVVDDGSTDGTYQRVLDAFRHDPRVRPLTKAHGGKGQALNYGIRQTNADIVVTLDADTVVRPDAIGKLVRHFVKPHVAAVAGNAKVGNRTNLLTRWQALEYITTQNLDKRAFEVLNCIVVVPGAIGAWRRGAVLRAGGFSPETLAEDTDLTLALLRRRYKIEYEEDAVGLTEAPDTMRSFLKQRFRWMYGTLQSAWKHIDTVFRPRYGTLGAVAIPYVLVFHLLLSLVAPIIDVFIILSLATLIWDQSQHPLNFSNETPHLLVFVAVFLTIDVLSSFLAFLLERQEDRRLLLGVVFQRFCYRQLMYYVGVRALALAIKGRIVGWSKFERKATVASAG